MSKINNYELMWILSSEDSDESIEKTINSVKDNISNSGGEISFTGPDSIRIEFNSRLDN